MAIGDTYKESAEIPIMVKVDFTLIEGENKNEVVAQYSEEKVREDIERVAKDLIDYSVNEIKKNSDDNGE